MKIIRSIEEMIAIRGELVGSVGFVPTMGALHMGHISLIRRAVVENDSVIVSIFVNLTQFLKGEDLGSYPNRAEADKRICEIANVDILFMPSADDIYTADELLISAPAIRGYILEGFNRAGHFDGVLQVVMKLLNITSPTQSYFGKKDAQQLALIKQMAKNYFLSTKIVPCDIVRDEQGLALSSRNIYLTEDEKSRAYALSRSINRATKMVMGGERDVATLIHEIRRVMQESDEIEYVAIVDRDFNRLEHIEIGNSMILVAAKLGDTRLIDNIWI